MPAPPLTIAQVSPFPWEDRHEVNTFAASLAEQLAGRGHRLLVLAPSRSPEAVRASRRSIRAARERPDDLLAPDGSVRVLSVGELLPRSASGRRAVAPALPVDIARTLEEVLTTAPLDIVHVHEPFAPSASSVALRHSRALNVGTFHHPTERVLSTQVARRFVERFFGRLDARTASHPSTAELVGHWFPAEYRVITPGVELGEARPPAAAPLRIAYCVSEERSALRVLLRALRRLPEDADWQATVFVPYGAAPIAPLGRRLRDRLRIVSGEDADEASVLADADVLVAASSGVAPDPALLLRAIGSRAIPVVSSLPSYEDALEQGELGMVFERGDADTLAALLERLLRSPELRDELHGRVEAARERLSPARVADEYEALYAELAARRHSPADGALHVRLASRPLIDVDLHMHTDHSHDCATPVEVLLATAREQGLGAIAVTDHNEISGALAAQAISAEYGVKVIVGEEVKTADQGEVIGLFLSELIPRGMSLEETIAAIRAQGGLVYVPHPFDRLHTVPDYPHLLSVLDEIDLLEVFNPRIAIREFNEEAVRFAAKYRIAAGAGSDSHVPQGLGSVRVRMRDFEGPAEFVESLRDADIIGTYSSLGYVQVQAIKFLQTRATPATAREASRRRRVRRAVGTADRNR